MSELKIRPAEPSHFERVWEIFHPVVSSGETYGFPLESNREDCQRLWFDLPQQTFVTEDAGSLIGTYYIKPNGAGPSDHICNCGYMVAPEARGRGVAAAMCTHSQGVARTLGFKLMQFNAVVSTNTGAIRLWERLGFETVGRVPRAFRHPKEGYVDTFVMTKWLGEDPG
ncbi:MAG: GNAT family N-acetyltransferase [Pseudomonadota bacterium]